jgi:outer membrane protein OmpA-like peptidoglycan-associated protein
MRRTYQFLLATAIVAAPLPVAAQVSVDLNALNRLGAASLPAPPPSAPFSRHRYHHTRHLLAHTEPGGQHGKATAVATAIPSAATAPTGPDAIEHPANLGASFASLPSLPGAAPPMPPPPSALTPTLSGAATPAAPAPVAQVKAPAAKPAETAAAAGPAAPMLALPTGAPPPPPALAAPASKPATPARLAEATPPPPAARPAPQHAAPDALPKGADRLTLPFFVDESDLPATENAMLRDFAGRYGGAAHYIVRAFATSPAGDDDPSTPRRIALARAQSVATALLASGVQPDRLRLLALGSAGGTPPDRVEVIAMPPSSGHTNTDSSP